MKLFEMKNWELRVADQVWGFSVFKKLLTRDKSKDKERALKEMLFIWHYCDIKSDYLHLADLEERASEIKKDIMLPKTWKIDEYVQAAIDFYKKDRSVVEKLYRDALASAHAIGDYLSRTNELLAERDAQGKIVTDIAKITQSVSKMPKLMADLKAAYKEVLKEKEDKEGRKKGSRSFNVFEDMDFNG
jgi:hypothetical protein